MSHTLVLEPDDIDFDHYMRDTEVQHKVKPIASWESDLNAEFADPIGESRLPKLPWRSLQGDIDLRPGEVSLWFGFNGHGKSLVLGQAILDVADQGEKACIASFEMRPRKTLGRMCRQFANAFRPTPQQVKEFVHWGAQRLWVYDQTGTVEPEKVYAVIRYAADKLGVSHFVVDNLTKMVSADDDYTGQKAIVDKLTSLALSLNIHIHLVHHARKDRDEVRPPRKMDALGASAITNLVDNVFIIWRNKAKFEAAIPDTSKPDAVFLCDKQRHGTGWEGVKNLSFHRQSQQFIEFGDYEALTFRSPVLPQPSRARTHLEPQ